MYHVKHEMLCSEAKYEPSHPSPHLEHQLGTKLEAEDKTDVKIMESAQ